MDYAAAREAFFAPPADGSPATPPVVATGGQARRLRDALEPLAAQPIWSPEAQQGYADLGLNFLTGYVAERSAALGAAPVTLVVSAFGVFAPDLLGPLYEESTAAPRDAVVRARVEGTTQTVRRVLDGAAESTVAGVVATLRRGLDAADGTARPLFSGLRGREAPADVYGELVHVADLLREHRGDSHLAACAVAGLDPIESNILTELHAAFPLFAYTGTRGWSEEQMGAAADRLRARGLLDGDRLSAPGTAFREEIELQTDRMQGDIVEAIGPDLERLTTQLAEWGSALVDAGMFPPDPAKRAAG